MTLLATSNESFATSRARTILFPAAFTASLRDAYSLCNHSQHFASLHAGLLSFAPSGRFFIACPQSLFPIPYSLLSVHFSADVEQDSYACQSYDDRCSAGGDQRQRNAFGGQQGEDYADVEEGLQDHGHGDAEGGQAGEGVLRAEDGAQAAKAEDGKEQQDDDGR